MMRRRVWTLVLAAPVVAAMALLVSGSRSFTVSAGQAQASSAEVKIDNFSFGPAAVTVAVGTTGRGAKREHISPTVAHARKGFKQKGVWTEETVWFDVDKPG